MVYPCPILRIHLCPLVPCVPLTSDVHNWQILSKMGNKLCYYADVGTWRLPFFRGVRTTQDPNFLLRCTGRASKSCPNPLYLKGLVLDVERLLAKESFGELK